MKLADVLSDLNKDPEFKREYNVREPIRILGNRIVGILDGKTMSLYELTNRAGTPEGFLESIVYFKNPTLIFLSRLAYEHGSSLILSLQQKEDQAKDEPWTFARLQQLAQEANLPEIINEEKDKIEPTLTDLSKTAKALGLSLDISFKKRE